MSKERLGSDPFSWIKDSREDEKVEITEISKQDNLSKQELQSLQNNISKSSLPELQDKQSNISKQDLQELQSNQDEEIIKESVAKKSTQKGLADGWTRATFIIKEENLEKLKDYAYWERLQIKDAVNKILTSFFEENGVKEKNDHKLAN